MSKRRSLGWVIILVLCSPWFTSATASKSSADAEFQEPTVVQQSNTLLQYGLADSAITILEGQLANESLEGSTAGGRRAAILTSLADCYCLLEEIDKCDSLRKLADSLWLSEFGSESLYAGRSQLALGEVAALDGRHDAALAHYDKARRLILKHFGEHHPEFAEVLGATGWSQLYLNHYDQGEQNLIQALDIHLNADIPDTSELMDAYNALSWVYQDTLPARADSLLQSVLALAQDNPLRYRRERADAFMSKAQMQMEQNLLSEAEHSFSESVRLKKLYYGENHPDVASTEARLAQVFRKQSRLRRAESCLKRTLAYYEQRYDPDHPMIAYELVSLALVYKDQGKFDQAEANIKRALTIIKDRYGEDHPGVSSLLNNLADVYRLSGRLEEAVRLFGEVVDRRRKRFGEDALITARTLVGAGMAHLELGNYELSDSLLTKALAIEQRSYGSESRNTAYTMVCLARVCYLTGRFPRARELAEQALRVFESALAPSHPRLTECRAFLGVLSAKAGKFAISKVYFETALRAKHDFINDVYSFASTDQKARYLAQYPLILDPLLEQAVHTNDSGLVRLAYEMVLNGRAKIVDVLATEVRTARCSKDERIHQITKQHARACTDISAFSYDAAFKIKPEIMHRRLQVLYKEKDSLESLLSQYCSSLDDQLEAPGWISMSDVVHALPASGRLLELVKYQPTAMADSLKNLRTQPEERYLQFIIEGNGKLHIRDVGKAVDLDAEVDALRDKIAASGPQVFGSLGSLYEKQLAGHCSSLRQSLIPLEWSWEDSDDLLYVVPDGSLNFLPFELLMSEDGSYLIEQTPICYLISGRELCKIDAECWRKDTEVLIVADPRFDSSCSEVPLQRTTVRLPDSPAISTIIAHGGLGVCIEEGFPDLPGSAVEARLIADHLKELSGVTTKTLLGVDARESLLIAELPGPRVLHISTHSFYCDEDELEESPGNRFAESLVRSGLAMAGANRTVDDKSNVLGSGEDGILTALEIIGLDLERTELVVLSSCESGVGSVVNHEGVIGLRYAFGAAGARTSIVSLWNVPDMQTVRFMDEFYRLWLSGSSKAQAHKQTCCRLIQHARDEYGHSHPLLWAGFVLTGATD